MGAVTFTDLLILVVLGAVPVYWFDAMRAKELARTRGREACSRSGLIFLDDTVVLTKTRLRRDQHGKLRIYREYRFEFTSDGTCRYRGEIVLMGRNVRQVTTEAYRIP